MTGWYAQRTADRSGRAVVALMLLAILLVAGVPAALLAGVIMMLLGHVIGGLALFGGSILAAGIAVAVAGMSGMRHLRKLVSGVPSVSCDWTAASTPTSLSQRATTTTTSCSWSAASTPKFADLAVPVVAAHLGLDIRCHSPGGHPVLDRLTIYRETN